jgi:hypothetical protein
MLYRNVHLLLYANYTCNRSVGLKPKWPTNNQFLKQWVANPKGNATCSNEDRKFVENYLKRGCTQAQF